MSIGFVVAASLRILDNCSADGCLKKASDLQEDWIFQPHCIHDSAPLEEKERVQRHSCQCASSLRARRGAWHPAASWGPVAGANRALAAGRGHTGSPLRSHVLPFHGDVFVGSPAGLPPHA